MAKNFPKLVTDTKPYSRSSSCGIPNMINTHTHIHTNTNLYMHTPVYTVLLKTKDRENLEVSQRKKIHDPQRNQDKNDSRLLISNPASTRQWSNIFKVPKEKTVSSELFQQKPSSQVKEKQSFSDKQKWMEFITCRCTSQEMLKFLKQKEYSVRNSVQHMQKLECQT